MSDCGCAVDIGLGILIGSIGFGIVICFIAMLRDVYW